MNIPELFDVVDMRLLCQWRQEIEKNDKCLTMEKPQEEKENLLVSLSDEQKQNLQHFELAIINRMDYIYYTLCKQLFYFSVKAGMDMQKAYSESN